jgi:hypothetical protein
MLDPHGKGRFLILSSATLTAAPLARSEGTYVELMTLSIGVTNMCDGYDVDDTNVLKFAEMNSVNIRKLGPATSMRSRPSSAGNSMYPPSFPT